MKGNEPEVEIIAFKIGQKIHGTYKGFGGTFASFVDCCLRKKVLAGVYEEGIIAEAELKDHGLSLCLSGKRTQAELTTIMDIALLNIGALPESGGKAKWLIEVTSR